MCAACKQCWIKFHKKLYQSHNKYADKSNALLVGGLYRQNLITFVAPRLYEKYIQAEKREKKKGGTNTIYFYKLDDNKNRTNHKSNPCLPPNEPFIQKFPLSQLSVINFISEGGIIL